ncbi:MAG: B3/4 domain-containing protein [Thermoplasmatota archaeon]
MEIRVDESVRSLAVNIKTYDLSDIEVGDTPLDRFSVLSFELRGQLRERFPRMDDVRKDRTIRSLRDLYWRIGIDPTKQRPSSEALLRRILVKELPVINNLVDAGNLASAKTLIPVGIYDVDRIEGDPVLRLSRGGESFHGIGGKEKEMKKGHPVLADDRGIIHLYPYRDSMRTRITKNCANALVVACGAKGIRERVLIETLDSVDNYFDLLGGVRS